MKVPFLYLAWLMYLASLVHIAAADDPPQQDAAQTALARFQREAESYEMQIGDERPAPLELQTKPILHWGNPAGNGEDGAVFVWLQHGRPEVIGTFFTYRRGTTGELVLKHSLHSLSDLPIAADCAKLRVWSPKSPGVAFHPLPDAPPPADSSRARLLQVKALAKDFSGKLVDLRENSTELRLLPQPLIRYEPTAGATVDGAIFALAEGTDPQILVLIEARKGKEDVATWQYGFARFHFVHLWGYHKGNEVWHVEADPSQTKTTLGDPAQAGKIYISLQKK